MATSAMTIRLDSQIKRQFDALCQQFGMSSNTAINIFVNQVVRSRGIPFMVTVDTENGSTSRQRAIEALRSAHDRAITSSEPELTLDEINDEIREVRRLRQGHGKTQDV